MVGEIDNFFGLFVDEVRQHSLARAMDHLRDRYGNDAILRAEVLTPAGHARERVRKMGGHYGA